MPANRVCLLLCALVLLLVDIAAVEAQGWTKYTYAEDGFEVEFSGNVKVSPAALDAETLSKIVRATNYLQDGGEYAFIVAASLQRVDVNFSGAVENSLKSLKCSSIVSDTPLPFPDGRAREIRGTNCAGGTFRTDTRYFTVGRWLYVVIALHPTNGSRAAEARRFVESFRLTGAR